MTPGQLRSLIVAAGISQQELARRIPVDPSTVRRWLSGSSKISAAMEKLVRAELRRTTKKLSP